VVEDGISYRTLTPPAASILFVLLRRARRLKSRRTSSRAARQALASPSLRGAGEQTRTRTRVNTWHGTAKTRADHDSFRDARRRSRSSRLRLSGSRQTLAWRMRHSGRWLSISPRRTRLTPARYFSIVTNNREHAPGAASSLLFRENIPSSVHPFRLIVS